MLIGKTYQVGEIIEAKRGEFLDTFGCPSWAFKGRVEAVYDYFIRVYIFALDYHITVTPSEFY